MADILLLRFPKAESTMEREAGLTSRAIQTCPEGNRIRTAGLTRLVHSLRPLWGWSAIAAAIFWSDLELSISTLLWPRTHESRKARWLNSEWRPSISSIIP